MQRITPTALYGGFRQLPGDTHADASFPMHKNGPIPVPAPLARQPSLPPHQAHVSPFMTPPPQAYRRASVDYATQSGSPTDSATPSGGSPVVPATVPVSAVASPASPSGVSAYEELDIIGEGTFGRVARVRRRADGEIFVWKELCYGNMSEREKAQLVAEVNILRELDHAHIVRYHDRIIDRQRRRIYIVMEHCPGGDLAALIKRATRSAFSAALTGASAVGPVAGLPEAFVWRVLAHVAQALHACHSRPQGAVLHRDLKPGNILLDAEGRAKLCDFGLARVLAQAGDCARTHVGTPYYMSPEQCLGTGYGAKSDIWSLGCLVYELCALEPPFKALTHYTLSAKIQRGRFAPLPPAYSPELGAVVAAMLRVEAAARPAVADILTVPAVAAIVRGDAAPRPAAPATTPAAAAEDAQAQALQTQARELIAQVQRRERAVATKELELQHREQDVARRELELARKELEWARRTAEADAREAALEKRLRALAAAVPASAPEAEVDVPE